MRLAAMHYNENCNRRELTNEDDQPLYRTTYVKWQGGKAKVVRVLAPTTNGKNIYICFYQCSVPG